MKAKLVVGLAVVIGCVVAGVMVVRRQSAPQAAPQTVKADRSARPAAPTVEAPAAPEQSTTSPASTPQTQPVKPAVQSPVRQQPAAVAPQAYQDPGLTDVSIPEPLAREALSFVGADRDAEWVWYQAINDTRLTPDERQNLIEDLNEDGFPDPDNLTPYDLPLIENRLALIEEAAPESVDEVNAAAFLEAYKDLIDMYRRVTGF